MSRLDPIQYAERLYAAIRGANFSTLSFLAFGNAVKDGVEMRRMPRIAAEPFMRVVGEMLELEEATDEAIIDAETLDRPAVREATTSPPAVPLDDRSSAIAIGDSDGRAVTNRPDAQQEGANAEIDRPA